MYKLRGLPMGFLGRRPREMETILDLDVVKGLLLGSSPLRLPATSKTREAEWNSATALVVRYNTWNQLQGESFQLGSFYEGV